MDFALQLAASRHGYLTSATKSNGIVHTLPFWDQIVAERAALRPEVQVKQEHIDALCAKLVLSPQRFDVIVASNLFGDILSDLAAAMAGSIGIAPSANINPERGVPVDVRTSTWLGAGYQWQRHRQPTRRDLVGSNDARPSR